MPAKKQSGTHLEIKLTPDSTQNVLLIRGPADGAPQTRVTGQIAIHCQEALGARKVSIKLLGTMKLKWDEQLQVSRMQPVQHPVRYEKTVFEQEIDITDKLTASGAAQSKSNPGSGKSTPKAVSSTNLAGYFGKKGGSSSNLAGLFSSHSASTSPQNQTPQSYLSRTSSSLSVHMPNGKKNNDLAITSGVHTVPFEIIVPGSIPESVEGNDNASIIYWLVATVERGRFQHNIVGRKHMRIMRTLAVDTYDAAQSISIENVWPKKVEYTIEVPSKAIPVGGSADVHFSLSPLQKGLSLGKVKLTLAQSMLMHLPSTQNTTIETNIVEKVYKPPTVENEDLWQFSRSISLPSSLSKVTPDCLVQPNVKVTHKIKIVVALKNGDGHTSELRASLPVQVFVSPRVPVVANDIEASGTAGVTQVQERVGDEHLVFASADAGPADEDDGAPPNYHNYIYDRLFSEVATPATPGSPVHSGGSTPAWRGVSLNSLNATQRDQLSSRLQQLQMSQENESSSGLSASSSTTNLNNSGGMPTPPNVETLSRVPSYEAALQDLASADQAPNYN